MFFDQIVARKLASMKMREICVGIPENHHYIPINEAVNSVSIANGIDSKLLEKHQTYKS